MFVIDLESYKNLKARVSYHLYYKQRNLDLIRGALRSKPCSKFTYKNIIFIYDYGNIFIY
jgi:hypothetical protein